MGDLIPSTGSPLSASLATSVSMPDLEALAKQLTDGAIDGNVLATMVEKSEITKQERRKIGKISQALLKRASLTKRQLERRAAKEKKMLPKITKEDRKRKYHEVIESQREKEAANFTICLGCRKRGHFLKDCPKAKKLAASESAPVDHICFNCGSTDHSLKNCLEPRDPSGKLPFATCFICKGRGHLSRECPENANGIYPKGGCCHICLQKTHLARDCPERTAEHDEQRAREFADGVRMEGLVADKDEHMGGDSMPTAIQAVEDSDQSDSEERRKKKKKKSKHH